jgi:putative addiction module killer protein
MDMLKLKQTDEFEKWLDELKDKTTQAIISTRVNRVALGNFGDTKVVASGVYELRIHYGAGYRVYFTKIGQELIFLLYGGTKNNQQKDIDKAIALAKEIKEGNYE